MAQKTATAPGLDAAWLEDFIEQWEAAWDSHQPERVLELMTDDIVFMTSGREPFGKEEFKAQSKSMEGMQIDGRADIREIRVLGDWAWVHNHIDLTVTPPGGGEPVHRSGYTLSILEKGADGKWRLARDANLVS